MKTTAYIYEHIEGSNWRLIEKRTASLWLLRAYIKALMNRYDERYKLEIISGGAA